MKKLTDIDVEGNLIILDGLDEYQGYQDSTIDDEVAQALLMTKCKIFITTRPWIFQEQYSSNSMIYELLHRNCVITCNVLGFSLNQRKRYRVFSIKKLIF